MDNRKSPPWGIIWLFLLASCGAPRHLELVPYAEDPSVPSLAVHYVSHAPEMHERLQKIAVTGTPSPAALEAAGKRDITSEELRNASFSHHDTRYLWGRQSFWELARSLTWNQPTPEAKVEAIARWVSLNVNPRNIGDMPRERGVFPETVLWRGFGNPWECFMVFHALCHQAGIDAALWEDVNSTAPQRVLARGAEGWWRVDIEEGCLVRDDDGQTQTLEEELANSHSSTLVILKIPFDPRASSPRWKAAAAAFAGETPARFYDDVDDLERHLKPLLPRGGRLQWVDACGQGLEDWLNGEIRASAFLMARVTQGQSLQARALLLAGRARESLRLYELLHERDDIDDFYEAQAAFALRRRPHAWEKFLKVADCGYLLRLKETCHRHIQWLRSQD